MAKKKPSKKAEEAKPKKGKRKKSAVLLSQEERSRLLKPRTEYLDVLERVVREWKEVPELNVPGLTASKLASLGAKAERAARKEREFEEAITRKLAPLSDARRTAHDAAYRALLDAHAAVKLHARVDPGISERFGYLADLVRNAPSNDDDDAPARPIPSPDRPTR